MDWLTPGERRGALLVLGLFALGTVWDLFHVAPVMAPDPAGGAGVVTAPADTAAVAAAPTPTPTPSPPSHGGRRKSLPARPLDLGTASATELASLPGIGPVLAERIVAHRREHGAFRSLDELLAVKGIGPRLLARIAPALRVATPQASRSVQDASAR